MAHEEWEVEIRPSSRHDTEGQPSPYDPLGAERALVGVKG
jgi:hypothetical protein